MACGGGWACLDAMAAVQRQQHMKGRPSATWDSRRVLSLLRTTFKVSCRPSAGVGGGRQPGGWGVPTSATCWWRCFGRMRSGPHVVARPRCRRFTISTHTSHAAACLAPVGSVVVIVVVVVALAATAAALDSGDGWAWSLATLKQSGMLRMLRESLGNNFGDVGVAESLATLQVSFASPRALIVRCAREQLKPVRDGLSIR